MTENSSFETLNTALNALAKVETKANVATKRVAAAALVRLVDLGADKAASAKVQAEVTLKVSLSNAKQVMAWVNKAEPHYGAVVRDAMPDAERAVENLIDVMRAPNGSTDWSDVREQFRVPRPDKAAKAPPAPSVTDGTSTPLPASDVVPLTALQAVLNRLPELTELELVRVLTEATSVHAEKVAEREARVAASVEAARAA